MTIKYYARDDTGEYVDLDTYPPEKKQEILAAAGEIGRASCRERV